jgi:HlyD family type I secretion membrane fusion protein
MKMEVPQGPNPDDVRRRTFIGASGLNPIQIGYITVGCLVLLFCIWSTSVPLAESSVATGVVNVSAQRRPVAHVSGGRIQELLVKEGDQVQAGDLLLRIDGSVALSEMKLILYQYHALKIRVARLLAEGQHEDRIMFDSSILKQGKKDKYIEGLIDSEIRYFNVREEALQSKKAILEERILAASSQKERLSLQNASLDRQIHIVREQLNDAQRLFGQGHGKKNEIHRFDLEIEQLNNRILQIENDQVNLDSTIEEAKRSQVLHDIEFLDTISEELAPAQTQLAEFQEKLEATERQLRDLEVRAPVDGIVIDLKIKSADDVITSAERFLDILPTNSAYMVEAKIQPQYIDGVAIGQPVEIRFPAYAGKYLPTLHGAIKLLSADTIIDEQHPGGYYLANVEIDDQKSIREQLELLPGMPAEIIIKKRERTLLGYLIDPVSESISKAFVQ